MTYVLTAKMHNEKKVKKGKAKRSSKNKLKHLLSIRQSILNIRGVDSVGLNTITQKIVGCVVGQHVTNEKPWIFIKKEIIEDNLELHEHSSDFLPISRQIKSYPEQEILVGYDRPVSKDVENFIICTTVYAKDATLQLLEAQEQIHQELLNSKMQKMAAAWNSLGSEPEVEELIVKPLRPLLSTEIQCAFPLTKSREPLGLLLADQTKNGYVEILPGRFESNHILRRKGEAGVQAAPKFASKFCQTMCTNKRNKVTQCEYIYKEVKYGFQDIDDIARFFKLNKAYVIYELAMNQCIDLHHNDYDPLKHKEILADSFNLQSITSFKDVIHCPNIKVSALTWHPLISGIIAAAYIVDPAHQVITREPEFNCERDELEAHLVLIWCETDPYKPKIYLRSPRAVNCLLFCPTNYNLLIGGLTSGQIVIWDLADKLYEVERKELLTHEEAKHRVIVQSHVSWMKDIYDLREMNRPTVVSSLVHSHTELVTGISWLRPEYEFDKIGHVIPNPNNKGLQFFSSGMDSIIYVWDLQQRAVIPEEVITKKQRFRPKDILVDQSPFRPLNAQLKPFYKIIIRNPLTKKFLPIYVLNFHATNYVYQKIQENKNRVHFEHVRSENLMEFKHQFLVTTSLGGIATGSWSGLPFNQGVKLHAEFAEMNELCTIHDGPITVCLIHPFYANYFLTVGGKVFAVWNIDNMNLPLYWRKSSQRYVSGVWSPNHSFAVLIARQDITFQLWNLIHKYKRNRHIVKSMDTGLMALYSEYGKDHVKQGKIATTNLIGSIRIFQFPNLSSMHLDLLNNARTRVENVLLKREKILMNLFKKGNKIQLAAPTSDGAVSNNKDIPKIERERQVDLAPAGILNAKKYRESLEKYIYESIIKRHRINIADIQNQEKPIKKKLRIEQKKERKLKQCFKKREEIFENAKKSVIKKKFECKHRRYIGITIPEEQVPHLKNYYFISYKPIEVESLRVIRRSPFKFSFDWNVMMNKGKTIRSEICKENISVELSFQNL